MLLLSRSLRQFWAGELSVHGNVHVNTANLNKLVLGYFSSETLHFDDAQINGLGVDLSDASTELSLMGLIPEFVPLSQGDEARHEGAYQKVVEELFRRDPNSTMIAFAHMMRTSIVMPAHLLNDGVLQDDAPLNTQPHRTQLFNHFASVAERTQVYTAHDYADIVAWLVKRWRISDIQVRAHPVWDSSSRVQRFLSVVQLDCPDFFGVIIKKYIYRIKVSEQTLVSFEKTLVTLLGKRNMCVHGM